MGSLVNGTHFYFYLVKIKLVFKLIYFKVYHFNTKNMVVFTMIY